MKTSIIMIILFLLVGCQTAAQRQAIAISEGYRSVIQKKDACVTEAMTEPSFHLIAGHWYFTEPTLAQLTNNNVPTTKEIQALIAFHDKRELCRIQELADLRRVIPGIIPICTHFFHSSDLITADLVEKKITWGQATKKRIALFDEFKAQLQVFFEQLDRELSVSHESEIAQRQALSRALGAAAAATGPNSWGGRLGAYTSGQRPSQEADEQPQSMHCTMVPDGNGNLTGNCQ